MRFRFMLVALMASLAALVAVIAPTYASAASPSITSRFAVVTVNSPWLLYGTKELVGATNEGNPTSSPTYTEKVQMREVILIHGFRMTHPPTLVNGTMFLALRNMGLALSKMDVSSSYSTRAGDTFLRADYGSCSLYWPLGKTAYADCGGVRQTVSVSPSDQPFLAPDGTVQYPAVEVFQLLGFQAISLNGRLGIYSLPPGGISY
jgi:hypothetical protein